MIDAGGYIDPVEGAETGGKRLFLSGRNPRINAAFTEINPVLNVNVIQYLGERKPGDGGVLL